MKNILTLLTVTVACILFVGCASKQTTQQHGGRHMQEERTHSWGK